MDFFVVEMPLTYGQMVLATLGVLALLLVAALGWAKRGYAQPYERIEQLLTPSEQRFFGVLSEVVGKQALVMVKVRLADVVRVKKSVPRKWFWRHFSQISQKHVDFVLVDRQSFAPLCLIELDDRSHALPSRRKRDQFVNQTLQQVQVPLHRFAVKRSYDRTQIKQTLAPCFTR